jgi:type II secretory pathway component PulC
MAGILLVAGLFAWSIFRMPRVRGPVDQQVAAQYSWPAVNMPADALWDIFQHSGQARPTDRGPFSDRFRLAGTFFSYGGAGATSRKAIVDDLQSGEQHLVSEGGRVGDVQVVSVFSDRIVLRRGTRESELWLSFGDGASRADEKQATGSTGAGPGLQVLEENAFGKRVATNRWVIRREALMDYYHEMVDDPERLAALYLSLKADRDDERRVRGYYLDPEGEYDFFAQIGLHTGDVIRTVNSMRMTSQSRAEYFIREFVNKRVNAIVMDVERGEDTEKLIYLIR